MRITVIKGLFMGLGGKIVKEYRKCYLIKFDLGGTHKVKKENCELYNR